MASAEERRLAIYDLNLSIERDRRLKRTRLFRYVPYPKQAVFHAAGAKYRERLFLAGNRCGKTECGAAEMAFHLRTESGSPRPSGPGLRA